MSEHRYENLLVEHLGAGVARLTINRPAQLNALSQQVLDELLAAVAAFEDDREVRVVILTGAGEKAFVAGADIKAMSSMDAIEAQAFSGLGHRLGEAIATSRCIYIAAVNGYALGGGCELTLACDFAYASERAKFGQPEVNLGVIPGFGGTTRLARRVGLARATELAVSAATISADEALRIGLVNRVLPPGELLAAAEATAKTIASKGPIAVAHAKRSLRASQELPLAEQNRLEAQLFADCFNNGDQREGMLAFVEKRSPEWPSLK